jgi:diguanylate cyclase (GGDEF)-like protein
MSTSFSNHFAPSASEKIHELQHPYWHLFLRITLAILALSYAYFVPEKLVATTYNLFIISTILYISLQVLLWLVIILNRTTTVVLHTITAIDIIATLAIIINDPAPIPPSLILAIGALTLAIAQHRFKSFTAVFGVFSILLIITLIVRHQFLNAPYDIYFAAMTLFSFIASGITIIIAAQTEALRQHAAHVTETDPLTGLGNRWTFYEAAKYLLPFHHRNLTPMVVMYAQIEVTHYKGKKVSKALNDSLLKQFASIISQRLRGYDIATHYGDNEFAFLLADTTSKDAEKIAFDVQQQFDNWAKQKEFSAYVHIGMSIVPARPVALDQILTSINAALYRARQYKKGVSGAVFADPEQIIR